jgi:mRNA-degrading endonuclease RelE of RelBE toxin-antitoxin system
VGVCHVLRYTPYFRELKEILDAKMIGEVISIQHLEPIEHIHMSHSYVRGNWRNTKIATPIILAKSCHDTDIIRWLVNDPADNVHCFGNLKWFKNANAPEGSTERCTDGCTVEHSCPYSALQIYYQPFDARFFKLPPEIQSRIEGKIDAMGLRLDRFPHHRLTRADRYRLRVGDYRVIYTFDVGRNTIHLLAVGHRREVYREMR